MEVVAADREVGPGCGRGSAVAVATGGGRQVREPELPCDDVHDLVL